MRYEEMYLSELKVKKKKNSRNIGGGGGGGGGRGRTLVKYNFHYGDMSLMTP